MAMKRGRASNLARGARETPRVVRAASPQEKMKNGRSERI